MTKRDAGFINEGIESVQKRGSRIVGEGARMLPAASLMKAAGVIGSMADRRKPFVTVVNSYTTHIPGHAHLEPLGHALEAELKSLGYNVWYCNIGGAVDDGIAMGHFGMKYSLPSRELITDQIETVIGAHPCDGWVGIGNCDKIVPAMYNAMARLNIPAVYVSGGPMLAGKDGSDLISVFEGVGKESVGKMTEAELAKLAEGACPTCGSCSGMFTANSMNCLGEVVGLALPGNGTISAQLWDGKGAPVANPERESLIRQAAHALKRCMDKKIRPRDIVTLKAIDNAFICDMAMGGSTNTILHTLALAREAGIPYDLKRLNALSRRTPCLCKVSPSRPDVHVEDVHKAGGIAAILKEVAKSGAGLDKSALTVTGVLGDMVEKAPEPDGNVIRRVENPFSRTGGLAILFGSLAPRGSVVKTAGVTPDMMRFEGPAAVFDSQEAALDAWTSPHGDRGGDPLRGPPRGPRHAGNVEPHRRHHGRGAPRGLDHRRPFFRRHPGALRRPYFSRGGGRGAPRVGEEGRPDPDRRRKGAAGPACARQGTGPAPESFEAIQAESDARLVGALRPVRHERRYGSGLR